MARTRNLKPAFFKNEDLAECDPVVRLLFAGLWTLADREGRLECRPKRIRAELFPYDSFDVAGMLDQLAARGFIRFYEVDGQKYVEIPTFPQHQNPHHGEKAACPAPPNRDLSRQVLDKSETCPEFSRQVSDKPCTDRALNLVPSTLHLAPSTSPLPPRENTHTHTHEAGNDFPERGSGWAAAEWDRFASRWNTTARARPWTAFSPPDGWVDYASRPGWLDKAGEALDRLPGCEFFEQPLAVTKFLDFVDRILAGEFDHAKSNGRPRRQLAKGRL